MSIDKICYYLAFITGFFGAALFPISLGPFTLFPFRIFLILLWGLVWARMFAQLKIVLPMGRVKPYMAFAGIWIAYAMISLTWAAAKDEAVRHVIFLIMGISLWIFAIIYFCEYRDLIWLYKIWFIIFCLFIMVGFWEYLTGQHLPVSGINEVLILKPYVRERVSYMPTAVFFNPNDYATFLGLSIPFGLSLGRHHRKPWLRTLGVATVLLSGYLILAAESRGNLLALLFELLFLWYFLVRGAKRLKLAVAVAAIASIVLVLAPIPSRVILQKTTEQLVSIPYQISQEHESISIRWNLLKNGLLFLYQTAGFGVGAGNAEYWMANFANYPTYGLVDPHIWWLELLVNYGIFVFTGYLLFYISIIRRLLRIYKHTNGELRMICEALLLSLIGFSIASVSSSSIMAFTPQWLLFGFSLAFINTQGDKGVINACSHHSF
jgi:teichuronic acid biosynthesis protein TuaE